MKTSLSSNSSQHLPFCCRVVLVPHCSATYWRCVALRAKLLRAPLGLQFTTDQLAEESDSLHLALIVGQELVGCLVLKPVDHFTLKMRQVAIDTSYQGRSLGRLLVRAAEQIAEEVGAKFIILHARQSAVPFYQRLGYQIVGQPFLEVGLKHLKMSIAIGITKD